MEYGWTVNVHRLLRVDDALPENLAGGDSKLFMALHKVFNCSPKDKQPLTPLLPHVRTLSQKDRGVISML